MANSSETIAAVRGDIVPKYFGHNCKLLHSSLNPPFRTFHPRDLHYTLVTSVEISNQCAKGRVVEGNITVNNGVVHVINGLLGFVHSDLYTAIDNNAHQ